MATPQTFVIAYSSTVGGTYTNLTNVQEISATIGRQTLKDQFVPSSLTFTMRYPTGFFSPNTSLVTGQYIRLTNTTGGSGFFMWKGRISDVTVNWGIQYNTTTNQGQTDYITVTCEGAMADWGRAKGLGETVTSTNGYYALAEVSFLSGLPIGTTFSATDTKFISASTVDGSYLEWINTFATTLGATVKDGSGQLGIYTKDFIGSLSTNFSDVLNNATNQVYEDIELTSQVENYFTEIVVNPPTPIAQQVAQYGLEPFRTLELDTYNVSALQGSDLANYYLAIYKTPAVGISKLVCRSEAQNSWQLDFGYAWYDILGYRTNVTFRGQTYYMTILGSSFTATPEGSVFTFYLADNKLTPFLYLNDATYGILGGTGIIYNTPMDYNESGYIYDDNTADNGNALGF